MLGREPPVIDSEAPVLDPERPMFDREPPMIDRQSSMFDREMKQIGIDNLSLASTYATSPCAWPVFAQ